jgi:transcriptional regulator with XRE-family HTH domain
MYLSAWRRWRSLRRLPAAPTDIIAENLRRLRADRGWTQEEAADRAGLQQPSYARIELGRSPDVKLSTLLKLAQAFDVPLSDVLNGVD